MEKKDLQTFVKPESALEGAGSLETVQGANSVDELLPSLPENASRDDVIESFMARQVELSATSEAIASQPGFNLDANQMLEQRAEQSKAESDLSALTETWSAYGGDDVIEAQKAVDALNFKSDANDRVAATTRLRDVKDAFFAQYQEAQDSAVTEADTTSPDAEAGGSDQELIPITRPDYAARRQAIIDSTPDKSGDLVPITRPAVKKYNQEQEANALDAPAHTEVAGSYDTKDAPIKGVDSTLDARDNWHDMMKKEREATAEVTTQRSRELGAAAVDLLSDSEVVQDYRERRAKRRSIFARLRGSFAERRLGAEHRKMQKDHAKEMKAFNKDAAKERALQDAEDKATIAGAGREAKLNDKLFKQRLEAEAKLKAKHDKQAERFNDRESGRLKRRVALGKAAAKTSLFFGR